MKKNRGFSPRQRQILLTFTDTLFPPAVGAPFHATGSNLVEPLEEFLNDMGKTAVAGVGMLLLVFEYAALIFVPRLKPFSSLDAQKREEYMAGWEASRISYKRDLFILLKFLVSFVLLSDKEIRASLGYDPECLVEMKK